MRLKHSFAMFMDAILTTYKQAGAREVLDHIMNRVNRANGVQDDPNDREE